MLKRFNPRTYEMAKHIAARLRQEYPERYATEVGRAILDEILFSNGKLRLASGGVGIRETQEALAWNAVIQIEPIIADMSRRGYQIDSAERVRIAELGIKAMGVQGTTPIDPLELMKEVESTIDLGKRPWGGAPHGPHPEAGDQNSEVGDPYARPPYDWGADRGGWADPPWDGGGIADWRDPGYWDDPPEDPRGGFYFPIVLDLDGDGIELVSRAESPAFYDVNGDGYSYNLGWVSSDDGLLAYDRDGDGEISGSDEISFVSYAEGAETDLEGLGHFDTDGDGYLTSSDGQFSKFRVWQDLDQDGVSDAGELRTLSEAGIEKISLSYSSEDDGVAEEQSGNRVHGEGEYTYLDSEGARWTSVFGDVSFEVSAVGYRTDGEGHLQFRVSESETYRLYDFSGSSESVRVDFSVEGYSAALGAFAGTGGSVLDGSDVLRDLLLSGGAGVDYLTGGSGDDWLYGDAGADELRGGAGHDILLFDSEDTTVEGGEGFDVGVVIGDTGVRVDGQASGLEAVYGGGGDDVVDGHEGTDVFSGGAGADQLNGLGGDDVLTGGNGNDILNGASGSDYLHGGTGADQLVGGGGGDLYVYERGDGKDTIRDAGDNGSDSEDVLYLDGIGLHDLVFHRAGQNLVLGIKDADAAAVSTAGDFRGLSDQIALEGWFAEDGTNRLERLVFSDGTLLDLGEFVSAHGLDNTGVHDVKTKMSATWGSSLSEGHLAAVGTAVSDLFVGSTADVDLSVAGKGGNDVLYLDAGDVFSGGEGWDTVVFTDDASHNVDLAARTVEQVYGGGGDDHFHISQGVASYSLRLYGGGGNDELTGGVEGDLLHGGIGADVLKGGARDDVYVFVRGDGWDEIEDYSEEWNDALFRESGIHPSDLALLREHEYSPLFVEEALEAEAGDPNRLDIEELIALVRGYGFRPVWGDEAWAKYRGLSKAQLGDDTLHLGGGISLADLVFRLSGADLQIGVKGAGHEGAVSDAAGFDALEDRVTIKGWTDAKRRVENLHLSDGTQVDLEHWVSVRGLADGMVRDLGAVMSAAAQNPAGAERPIAGTALGETLSAVSGSDWVDAGGGDDVVYARTEGTYAGGTGHDTVSFSASEAGVDADLSSGTAKLSGSDGEGASISGFESLAGSGHDDVLSGGAGSDRIEGGAGSDRLSGRGGNDILDGGVGDDVYLLGAGTDHDTIIEHLKGNEERQAFTWPTPPDWDEESIVVGQSAGNDTIQVKTGIELSTIRLSRTGYRNGDLLVELVRADGTSSDSLRVSGHFANTGKQIERIKASGRVLVSEDYGRLMDAMSAFTAGTSEYGTMGELLDSYWREESALADPIST